MDGRQHYEKAEKLLDLAGDLSIKGDQDAADVLVAQAQVHATLALASASTWPARTVNAE